jgi:hypothetical protein
MRKQRRAVESRPGGVRVHQQPGGTAKHGMAAALNGRTPVAHLNEAGARRTDDVKPLRTSSALED